MELPSPLRTTRFDALVTHYLADDADWTRERPLAAATANACGA